METAKSHSPAPDRSPSSGEKATAAGEHLARLRHFHLSPPSDPQGPRYLPALLQPFLGAEGSSLPGEYPVFLGPLGTPGEPTGDEALCFSLPDLIQRLIPEPVAGAEDQRLLRDNLRRFERALRRVGSELSAPADARQTLARASEALLSELSLPPGDGDRLAGQLESLQAALPAGSLFVPEGPEAPFHLLRHALLTRRVLALGAFRAEARELSQALADRLEADRRKSPESRGEQALGGALGNLGARFVNPAALAGMLGEPRGSSTLQEERRTKLEEALAILRRFVGNGDIEAVDLITAAETDDASAGPAGYRLHPAADPCAAAAELFDRLAAEAVEVFRALRLARLEIADKYQPTSVDPWLQGLDWQSLEQHELALIPPVVVSMSAEQLAQGGMVSLSPLLLSGRPVQVLLAVEPATNPGAEKGSDPLSSFRFEVSYLGLAHREAVVQQATQGRPTHMIEGFRRAARATHAALHVVAVPSAADAKIQPVVEAGAAVEGRAHPLFLYDPEAGSTWSRRLVFSGNPSPETDWPEHQLSPAPGSGKALEVAFTFADYALLHPLYRHHFLAVPEVVPDTELIPIAEYLGREGGDSPLPIPYLWALDDHGRRLRLAVSRPLALAARDRLNFWRTLQELAGVKSEYVEEATAKLREELEKEAGEEREKLSAAHAQEIEGLRATMEREVVERLTAALLEVDVTTFAGELTQAPTTAAPGLAGFAGRDVDQVAAALLELVGTELTGEGPTANGKGAEAMSPTAGGAADEIADSASVEAVAGELLHWVREDSETSLEET